MTHRSDHPPPLGRRARKALAVRQALFEAGLASFDRQPISLVSVLDITERADVAKGVFYLHFRSKDDYLLELWTEAHRRFLERAQPAARAARSRSARMDAVIREIAAFGIDSPSAARFWIRMLSFFPDEIGPPGSLSQVRRAYIQELTGLVAGKESAQATDSDVRTALLLDALCWSIVSASMHADPGGTDPELLVKTVGPALRGLQSSGAER